MSRTYMRTTSLDRLVEDFLAGGGARQVVSLGAGTDTRLFRIQAQRTADAPRLVYHEVDFPTVTARKVDAVARDGRLMGAVRALAGLAGRDDRDEGDGDKVVLDRAAGSLYSPGYNLHPVDLRAPPPTLPNLDPHLPTLVICECLLCYIVPSPTALLTHLLTSLLPAPPAPLGMLVYEPLAPASSAFARTMAANLARRAIRLALLPDLPAHLARLRQHGFPHAAAADVAFLWDRWIPDQEKSRVAKLEFLDELEEWRLIAGHYCVVWAWREEEEEEEEGDQTGVFAKWKELPCQERVLE
ncbi:MAG: carboxy methyl transferase for protein phosphatase 2A [Trichoglossum hirsutum]|nr:MAG: carboxy methyl transferase for protein phosphatase 2A [Trichoglossum hirsutum]